MLLQPKTDFCSHIKMLWHILLSKLLQQPIFSFSVYVKENQLVRRLLWILRLLPIQSVPVLSYQLRLNEAEGLMRLAAQHLSSCKRQEKQRKAMALLSRLFPSFWKVARSEQMRRVRPTAHYRIEILFFPTVPSLHLRFMWPFFNFECIHDVILR